MQRVPSAFQTTCRELGLASHREQQYPNGLPVGRRKAALDTAHSGLGEARAACERALAETKLFTMYPYQLTWNHHDIVKYIRLAFSVQPPQTR
jgi:hypothetical protein